MAVAVIIVFIRAAFVTTHAALVGGFVFVEITRRVARLGFLRILNLRRLRDLALRLPLRLFAHRRQPLSLIANNYDSVTMCHHRHHHHDHPPGTV